ncbi:hypothetical protein CR513_08400, partial [Mucuna pruriens]
MKSVKDLNEYEDNTSWKCIATTFCEVLSQVGEQVIRWNSLDRKGVTLNSEGPIIESGSKSNLISLGDVLTKNSTIVKKYLNDFWEMNFFKKT